MFKFSVLTPYLPLLESAVWVTLKFTFFSTFLGFIGGFLLALITIRRTGSWRPWHGSTFLCSGVRRFWCS